MSKEYLPAISFQAYRIEKFNYLKLDDNQPVKNKFQVNVTPGMSDDKKQAIIRVNVQFSAKNVDIDIIVNGYFNLEDGESSDFEKYLVINGTAILFPYIRSMVSMLTSLDNERAIILPTINTNSLWTEE